MTPRAWLAAAACAAGCIPAAGAAAADEWLVLHTPRVIVERFVDPFEPRTCALPGRLGFTLRRPARVSLTVGGRPALARVAGVRDGQPVPAGTHALAIDDTWLGEDLVDRRPFVLTAEASAGGRVQVSGEVAGDVGNPAVQKVGRTFVRNVDLLDGHLVRPVTDIDLAGRHVALQLTRTYSSVGRGSAGPVGAGWALSLARRAVVLPQCGLVVLRQTDGGSLAFRRRADGAYAPERGYNSTLRRNADGSFDFIDKAAVRHHFPAPAAPDVAAALPLAYTEEPHGDRLVLAYDARGRLVRAAEWHRRVGTVRTLLLRWTRAGGHDRVLSARAVGAGLRVDYRYDRLGNLVVVTRSDLETGASPEVDRYGYASADAADPHQLAWAEEAGRGRAEYDWYAAGQTFPGAGPRRLGLLVLPRTGEYVKHVRDTTPDDEADFGIAYDHAEAGQGRLRVNVNGSLVDRYLLDADGAVVELNEAENALKRKITRTEWDSASLRVRRQSDSSGAEWTFEYDERGNRTVERHRASRAAAETVTRYEYHPRFNRLTRQVDAQGQETAWELHPATGALLTHSQPGGKVTRHGYDADGCLAWEQTREGRTVYSRPDSFCQAERVTAPSGHVTRRLYDARARLTYEDPPRDRRPDAERERAEDQK